MKRLLSIDVLTSKKSLTRYIIYFIIFTEFLVFSCKPKTSNVESKDDPMMVFSKKVVELENNKDKCGIKDTTFLLGLKAYMNKEQVKNMLKKNLKEKKISYNSNLDVYILDMELETIGKCEGRIHPKYYEGSLYKVLLNIVPKKKWGNELVWILTYTMYSHKNGNQYCAADYKVNQCATWIFKNKHIDIINNVYQGVIVEYGEYILSKKEEDAINKKKTNTARNI